MKGENKATEVRTPVESFTQRIETLTDRIRESRGTISQVVDRIAGTEDERGLVGQDRPENAPGEYNTMNYAIDTLCMNVDSLQEEVARMQDRL